MMLQGNVYSKTKKKVGMRGAVKNESKPLRTKSN
jgi:hypothetical protein